MTVFNFPDTTGQPIDGSFTWTAPSGVLYVWNGEAWVTQGSGGSSGGGSKVYVTDDLTTIADPEIGDLAYHTVEARLYVYYQDSDSQQWVDASPAGDANDAGGDSLWSRVGSTLSPAFTGDDIETTGDLSAAAGTFNNGLTTYFPGVGGNVIQEWRSNYPNANHVKARLYANGGFSIGGAGAGLSTPVFSIGGLDGSVNIGGDIAGGNPNITLNAAGIITCGTNTPGGGAAGDINCHRMLVGSQSASQQFSIALVPSGTSQYNFAVRDTGLVSVGNALQSSNLNSDNITLQVGGTINALNEVVQPALSERRMKQNIADIDKDIAWNTVRDVPFREFEYRRNPDRKYYGNIVDEVEAVEPSLVVPSLLEDDEEGPIRTIDKNKLNGYLAVALQTALTRIEALEATNASLEARLTQLEGGN